jgi:hypothetical protein
MLVLMTKNNSNISQILMSANAPLDCAVVVNVSTLLVATVVNAHLAMNWLLIDALAKVN